MFWKLVEDIIQLFSKLVFAVIVLFRYFFFSRELGDMQRLNVQK